MNKMKFKYVDNYFIRELYDYYDFHKILLELISYILLHLKNIIEKYKDKKKY